MKSIIALLILCCCCNTVSAQHLPLSEKYAQFDDDRLGGQFHKVRRDQVFRSIGLHSVALFTAALEKNRANDVNYEYHQDPNFYYLTGHIQSKAALVLINGLPMRELLFVDKKNPARETWTGVRLGTEGGRELLGIYETHPIDSLSFYLDSILPHADTLYYQPTSPKTVYDPLVDTTYQLYAASLDQFKKQYPNVTITSSAPMMARLRSIKTPEEIELLKKAIKISNEAHNEIMKQVKPGWYEYQMQSLGEYIFSKNGAEYTGYPCIVGSGNNSTILHYETNRRKTLDGDFIEMDMGAEYHGYTADITRSFPVNGKFTPAQRAIYNIVLEAQDSGIAQAVVGKNFKAPHEAATKVIIAGLTKLGIIHAPEEYKKYFMHGTSHYLGLDVHDAGTFGNLEPNNVITVEPGIYIAEGSPCDPKWWKIGCRIEDDILITADGPRNLSIASPRKIEDIERLMKKGK